SCGEGPFLEELARTLAEDGLAVAVGETPAALLKAIGSKAPRGAGAALLAREAFAAISRSDRPAVLVLDRADHAGPEAARWWWAFALKLAGPGTTVPAVLVARLTGGPPAVAPWRRLEATLASRIPIRRITVADAA